MFVASLCISCLLFLRCDIKVILAFVVILQVAEHYESMKGELKGLDEGSENEFIEEIAEDQKKSSKGLIILLLFDFISLLFFMPVYS